MILDDAGERCVVFTHKTGLRVLFAPKDFHSSYALLGVRFGSFFEKCLVDGEPLDLPDGTAHFLEHKLFANEDGEDTYVKFARTGAYANAYTYFDQTCYLFSAPDRLEESLEILVNSVFSPCFTDENVKKEKPIILEELKMYRDDPFDRMISAVNRKMYKDHRLTRDIIGTASSVRSVRKEDLQKAYDLFYVPSNMILCLAGRFDLEKVKELLDRCVPQTGRKAPEIRPALPERFEDRCPVKRGKICKDVPLPAAFIGVKCPKAGKDGTELFDRFNAMSVIAGELFSEASDYVSSLKKAGLLLSDPSFEVTHGRNYSRILFSACTNDPEKVLDLFDDALAKLMNKGVKEENLIRGKKLLWAEFLEQFNSCEGTATRYFSDALEDLYTPAVGERIFALDAAAVDRTAKEILAPGRICRFAVYPLAMKGAKK